MSLKIKLLGTIALLSAIAISVSLYGRQALSNNNTVMEAVYADRIVPLKNLKIISDAYAVSIVDAAHKVRNGNTDMQAGHQSVTAAIREIEANWKAYAATTLTAEEAKLVETAKQQMFAADAAVTELDSLLSKQDAAGLDTFVRERLYASIDPLTATISTLSTLQVHLAEQAFLAQRDAFARANILNIGIVGVVLLLTGFCALMVSRGIVRPLVHQIGIMRKLTNGDLSDDGERIVRKDEIGEMASAIQTFRQAAVANRRLEQEAAANRIQAEKDRIRLTEEAEAAAQVRLRQATSGLALGLRRLASGDLSFQLNDAFAPDFDALREDLNSAVGQLAETLTSVTDATNSIDNGTREISGSAEDLARRTEQQAAALEETAAALDEITVNVSNSSRRADEARAVAVQANSSASHSGRVVADAVEAMRRIEESSKQISNIIGVIDEIAFQTNLLALNAGVEAARAGEAGKGFAVVAQEVRELAQRSAQAAREIKELIRNSTAQVEGGVKLVRETGDALKTIEDHVVTINRHMDAIATSAREQSVGLAEVNTAVNQMDQVTQQNAAMVEETNAASALLAAQSTSLRQLISQFTLSQVEMRERLHRAA